MMHHRAEGDDDGAVAWVMRCGLLQSRRRATVRRFIGEGSQGSVYDVVIEPTGEHAALKWYFPSLAHDRQRAAIEELVERGSPDDRFLWPDEMATVDGNPSFGYIMPLRPATTVGLSDLLTGKVDVPFSTVCTLGMELAGSFLELHSQGLCYRDISFGNVFFDPRTGRPLICDNDNVGVDGASPSAVLGTRRFMAPEIVRREVGSEHGHRPVLAVRAALLPADGRPSRSWVAASSSSTPGTTTPRACCSVASRGSSSIPSDESNSPLPEVHGSVLINWELYPAALRRLFVTAFTTGLTDPRNGRVRESVWQKALSRAARPHHAVPGVRQGELLGSGTSDADLLVL